VRPDTSLSAVAAWLLITLDGISRADPVILWQGRIVAKGPAADMWNSDDPFVRQFLGVKPDGPLTMD